MINKVELTIEEYEAIQKQIADLEEIISNKNERINRMENLLHQMLSPFGEHVDCNIFRNINENTRKTQIEYNPTKLSYTVRISYEVKQNVLE